MCCVTIFSSLCPLQFVLLLLWRQLGEKPPFLFNTLKTWRSPYFRCLPPLPSLQEHSSPGAFGHYVDTFMVCHEILRWSQLSIWSSVAQPPGTDQQINERGSSRPAGAHICSPLGCHKDRETERGILVSATQPSFSLKPYQILLLFSLIGSQMYFHRLLGIL